MAGYSSLPSQSWFHVTPVSVSSCIYCGRPGHDSMLPGVSNLVLWTGVFVVGLFTGNAAMNRNDPSYAAKIEAAKAKLAEQAKEGPVQPDDTPWPKEQLEALAMAEEEAKKDV